LGRFLLLVHSRKKWKKLSEEKKTNQSTDRGKTPKFNSFAKDVQKQTELTETNRRESWASQCCIVYCGVFHTIRSFQFSSTSNSMRDRVCSVASEHAPFTSRKVIEPNGEKHKNKPFSVWH
jgi:hypothetical protein